VRRGEGKWDRRERREKTRRWEEGGRERERKVEFPRVPDDRHHGRGAAHFLATFIAVMIIGLMHVATIL